MSEYPEHDKMMVVKDQSEIIGEFLDWATEKMIFLTRGENDGSTWVVNTDDLLAEFFEVDLKKIADEKEAMLDKMRELNNP